MTQAILSASTQRQTAARQYLTAEQDWALVTQVKERTELLKLKKDNFTLEEERIRIRGERAFSTLVKEYRCLIWRLVNRYSFSKRITTDEMYQIAIIAVNHAVNRHNPNREGKLSKFSSWTYFKVRFRLMDLVKDELSLARRVEVAKKTLVKQACTTNEQTPLKASLEAERITLEAEFRERLNQIITSTLPERNAQVIKEFYFAGKAAPEIAQEQGVTSNSIESRNHRARIKLKANPLLQELAAEYFA